LRPSADESKSISPKVPRVRWSKRFALSAVSVEMSRASVPVASAGGAPGEACMYAKRPLRAAVKDPPV
jgi:hypothetical protein